MNAPRTKILLIEDDDEHCELIQAVLNTKHGLKCHWVRAQSLEEAHQQLEDKSFDVVLLDLSLPDSPIEKTLSELAFLALGCPVIVLTSLDDPVTGQQAVQQGAEDYLPKAQLGGRRLADAIRYAIQRHGLKQQLRQAQEEAERAASVKADFLATMSHEIRTPMNAVIGFTNILLNTKPTEKQREYLETIQSSGEALLVIINDILDYSKIEAGMLAIECSSYDLKDTVEGVIQLLRPRAEKKGIILTALIDQQLPPALIGDASRLGQILMNLVGNALKFTERGSVTVVVSIVSEGAERRLQLAVKDTGTGIPQERLAVIFEKFTQVDNSTSRRYGGTGLGLAIARQLTNLMGGRISASSEVGVGSAFTVELPLVVAESVQLVAESSEQLAPDEAKLQGLRILVAEDMPTNQFLIRLCLEGFGCEVDIVGNGLEVLENLSRSSYDVLLMDCHMPEMDGYAATRRIRELELSAGASRIPIVALTAGAMAEDRKASLDSGMDDHLTKPLRLAELESVLGRWACRFPAASP